MSPRERDEPVRLTKIYTRGGDKGETSLGDGSRASKLDPRVSPTASSTSSTRSSGSSGARVSTGLRRPLERIQNELFDLGADLSVPSPRTTTGSASRRRRSTGSSAAATSTTRPTRAEELRPARRERGRGATARRTRGLSRAELATIAAAREVELDPLVAIYLNRLSDLLFILARASNDGDEPLWRPGG